MGAFRFFLALSVVVGHTGAGIYGFGLSPVLFLNTIVAVNVFFILSGFYMSLVINEKYVPLQHGIRTFYLNRCLRIYPIYLVVLAATFLSHLIISKPDIFTSNFGLNPFAWAGYIISNIIIVGQDILALVGDSAFNQKVLMAPQAWSLGVELFYYFAVAVVIARRRFWVAGLIMVGSFALRMYLVHLGTRYTSWMVLFIPSVLVFFMLGHFSYLMYRKINAFKSIRVFGWIFAACMALFLVGNIGINKGIFIGTRHWDLPEIWAFYIVVCLMVPFLFAISKSSRADYFLGQLSYPVYVCHWIVIEIIDSRMENTAFLRPYYAIILTLLVSVGLYFLIDKPVNKIKIKTVPINK